MLIQGIRKYQINPKGFKKKNNERPTSWMGALPPWSGGCWWAMVFACLIKDNFCSQTPHNTANTHTHYSNAHLHVEPYAPPLLQWILLFQMIESLLPLSHSKPSKKWCHQCYNQSIQKNQKEFQILLCHCTKTAPIVEC